MNYFLIFSNANIFKKIRANPYTQSSTGIVNILTLKFSALLYQTIGASIKEPV